MTHMKIILGPYFVGRLQTKLSETGVSPLKLTMEWATPAKSYAIHLFRNRSVSLQDRTRLEHLVFPEQELSCDIEYQEWKATRTQNGLFLPLDALLGALYGPGNTARPIFETLSELASAVQLDLLLNHSVQASGMLTPEAEARGFRLNAVFPDSDQVHVQLAWQPADNTNRFHVCLANFSTTPGGELNAGEWTPERETGVCRALAVELHKSVAGPPRGLLSESGRILISRQLNTS